MSQVNLYHFWCNNDSKWVEAWGTSEPQVCPDNSGHSGDTGATYIIRSIADNQVVIKEETADDPNAVLSGGHFHIMSKNFDCPGPTGTMTELKYSYPYPTSVINGYMMTDDSMRGDDVCIEVGKGVTIGALGASGASGATSIVVSSTVIPNTAIGRMVRLTDGTNTTPYIRINGISGTNSTLTLNDSLPYSFSPFSPTYVQNSIVYADHIELGPAGKYTMGTNKIGASHVPANTEFTITYTNQSNITKRPGFIIEMLY
jgi:hypothetical protein